MSFPPILAKIVGLMLALITPVLNFFISDFSQGSDTQVKAAIEKTGGFMKGVCHAEPQYDLLKEGNIEWFRDDIPFPYNEDGSISESYTEWKEYAKGYADNGIRIFGITPYPEDYIEYGLDPREPQNHKAIQDIARFYMEDLRGIVGAFQITNEMGIDRFTYPLTMEEAYEFIGMQLEAMYPVREDVIIGYNLAALSILNMPIEMKKYHQYCDYVGVDLYLGCFENLLKNVKQYITVLNYVRKVTQKPVILCEFGYIGLGEPKSDEEKLAILEEYGYASEDEAKADIDNFIKALPEELADEFDRYADETPEYRADLMFNGEFRSHLYRELPEGFGLYGFPHTPDGQAEFFSYIIPEIRKLDFVIGTFVYMWDDTGSCYVCGQQDCPVETKWGLVDSEGNPKPAYYAVQQTFAD